MKTAALPTVRVQPEFRAKLEGVLREGETLSSFVEDAVRAAARRRIENDEFIARGLRALEASRTNGSFYTVDQVMERLKAQLAEHKRKVAAKG